MSPKSGQYEISTVADTRVGRALAETKDLRPKKVFTNTDDPHPIWAVERLDNGNYYLYVREAPTASEKDRLFALLTQQEQKIEWCLEEAGPELSRIKDTNTGLFWTAPSFEEDVQVELKPLEAGLGGKQSFRFKVLE